MLLNEDINGDYKDPYLNVSTQTWVNISVKRDQVK